WGSIPCGTQAGATSVICSDDYDERGGSDRSVPALAIQLPFQILMTNQRRSADRWERDGRCRLDRGDAQGWLAELPDSMAAGDVPVPYGPGTAVRVRRLV